MSNMDVLIGIGYSAVALLGCFVIPIFISKLWVRYVEGIKKDDTNSGAKFG